MRKFARMEAASDDNDPMRRTAFRGGLAALFSLAFARSACAVEATRKKVDTLAPEANEWADRIDFTDVIMRERWLRETHNPDVSTSCFSPGTLIKVSWLTGIAAQFI